MIRYMIAYGLAAATLFLAPFGFIALCMSAGLGDTATMLRDGRAISVRVFL